MIQRIRSSTERPQAMAIAAEFNAENGTVLLCRKRRTVDGEHA
jgi:hypothetical protein